jgi:hypothetical protein
MINTQDTYVTENGDIEDWKSNSSENKKLMNNVKQYLSHLAEHIK